MNLSNKAQPSTSGWNGLISSFLRLSLESFIDALSLHHQDCMLEPPALSQIHAWENCFTALQTTLSIYIRDNPASTDWKIIFEYVLPRERGRRPDVVILAGETILVLEYKDYSYATQAHIDQVSAYVRDLTNYHAASQNHPIFLNRRKIIHRVLNEEGAAIRPFNTYANWYCLVSSVSTAFG